MIRGELVIQSMDRSESVLGTYAWIRTDGQVLFLVEEIGSRIRDTFGTLSVGTKTVIKYSDDDGTYVFFCKVESVIIEKKLYSLEKEYAIEDCDPDFLRFYCDWVDSVVEGREFDGF